MYNIRHQQIMLRLLAFEQRCNGPAPERTVSILALSATANTGDNHMKNMAGWCIDRCKQELTERASLRAQHFDFVF